VHVTTSKEKSLSPEQANISNPIKKNKVIVSSSGATNNKEVKLEAL
jgi:hypothetical protein